MRYKQKLPIAVEVAVAVVKTVAAVAPMAMRNAENAVHGAHRAADTRAERTADDSADRAGRAATFTHTFLGAADNALGVAGMGHHQQGQRKRGGRKIEPLRGAARPRQCLDIHFHLMSFFVRDCLCA